MATSQAGQPTLAETPAGWARSAVITAIFGGFWGAWGATTLSRFAALPWVFVAAGAVGIVAGRRLAQALQQRGAPAPANPLDSPYYVFSVAFEAIGITIAASLLYRNGLGGYFPPLTAVIVGLHFLGLVPALRSRHFYWVALAMVLVGVAGLVEAAAAPSRALLITGFGCAAILGWATLLNLLRARSALRRLLAEGSR